MMKKLLSILFGCSLLLACIPLSASGETQAELSDFWSKWVTLSDGADLDVENSVVKSGTASLTFTLPSGGYMQFNQKLTDMIGQNGEYGGGVSIRVGDDTKADYDAIWTNVQLTTDADAQSDITPVDEYRGATPSNKALTWQFLSGGSVLYVANGGSGAGGIDYGYTSNIAGLGISVKFSKTENGTVALASSSHVCNLGLLHYPRASTNTLASIGGEEGVYLRIRNGASKAVKYTVSFNSSDITTTYIDRGWTLSDEDSVITSQSTTIENGIVTERVTVSLSGVGSYAQFNKLLTNLIGNDTLGEDMRIRVGSHSKDDYGTSNFHLQLTTEPKAAYDILPVAENNGATPSDKALTWYFIGNTSLYLSRGSSSAGSTMYENSRSVLVQQGGIFTAFKYNSNDKKVYLSTHDSLIDIGQTVGYAPSNTLDSIGGNDGVYLRIRNNKSTTVSYELKFSYPVGAYTQGNWVVSDNDSVITQQTNTVSGSMTTESVTVSLAKPGSYVQFKPLLTDLIDGSAHIQVVVDDNTDYTAANMQVQLTADKDAKTDIVPVNENDTDPGTAGMTWLFQGTGDKVYTGRGNMVVTDSVYDTVANVSGNGGIKLKFYSNDGKVNLSSWQEGLTINSLPSTKTLDAIGGTDGVYVRLRNADSATVTYTFYVTYPTPNIVEEEPEVPEEPEELLPYTDGVWDFSNQNSFLHSAENNTADGNVLESATLTLAGGGWAQLNLKMEDFLNNGLLSVQLDGGNYASANFQIQLTSNSDATTDIVPVNENTADPGVAGMTWLFYAANGYLWTGRGNTTAYGGGYDYTSNIGGQGGVKLRFHVSRVSGKVYLESSVTTLSGTLPSTKTLTEIGGHEGIYVRIRNSSSAATTFKVSICEKSRESITTEIADDFLDNLAKEKTAIGANDKDALDRLATIWEKMSFDDRFSAKHTSLSDADMFALLKKVEEYKASITNFEYPTAVGDDIPIANLGAQVRDPDAAEEYALRFGFDMEATGITFAAGSYKRNLTESSLIMIEGVPYTVKDFGAILSLDAHSPLTKEAMGRGTDIQALNLYKVEQTKVRYTAVIVNVPVDKAGTPIYARPYVIYEDNGEEKVLYGDIVVRNAEDCLSAMQ